MAAMVAILKAFIYYLLSNCKSDGAKTWWKASAQYGDLVLLKLFLSDMQDGHHLENLQITSAPEQCLMELKPDGRHLDVMGIQNCLNCSFPIYKMAAILKFFKPHLLPNSK